MTAAIEASSAQTAAPPDATSLGAWTRRHPADLPVRDFVGTVREAAGFRITVLGAQRENGTALRRITVAGSDGCVLLEAEAARQLSAMLRDAADEIERLR